MMSIEPKTKINKSSTGTALKVIGYAIMVCGFFAGIALGKVETGYYYSRMEFSLALAMVYWISGFVSGMVFIGMGKIIELLTIIANKEYLVKNNDGNGLDEINTSSTVADIAAELPDL